jgi:type IV pilus assembly protein PilW
MKRQQAGLTLIELMVSLLLSSMLLLGLMQTFDANKRSNNLQVAFARVQETGRMATELIARDVRMADYWGCQSGTGNINSLLDTTDPDYVAADYDWLTRDAVTIDNDVAAGTTVGTLTVVTGTDVLTITTSSDSCSGAGRMASMNAANLKVSDTCALEIGQVVVVTNCSAGEMFTVTNFNACSSGRCTLVHHSGSVGVPGSVENAYHAFSSSYGADARVLTPVKKTYFIAEDGNGIPSLYLKENTNAAVQLVAGIEDMLLTVGEDTDADQQVNILTTATAGVNMDNVLSIKIQLQVRGEQFVNSSDSDGLLRKTFSATSTIRNRVI